MLGQHITVCIFSLVTFHTVLFQFVVVYSLLVGGSIRARILSIFSCLCPVEFSRYLVKHGISIIFLLNQINVYIEITQNILGQSCCSSTPKEAFIYVVAYTVCFSLAIQWSSVGGCVVKIMKLSCKKEEKKMVWDIFSLCELLLTTNAMYL